MNGTDGTNSVLSKTEYTIMTNLEFSMDFVDRLCLPEEGDSYIIIQMFDCAERTITDRWKNGSEKKDWKAEWNSYISPVNGISKHKKHKR